MDLALLPSVVKTKIFKFERLPLTPANRADESRTLGNPFTSASPFDFSRASRVTATPNRYPKAAQKLCPATATRTGNPVLVLDVQVPVHPDYAHSPIYRLHGECGRADSTRGRVDLSTPPAETRNPGCVSRDLPLPKFWLRRQIALLPCGLKNRKSADTDCYSALQRQEPKILFFSDLTLTKMLVVVWRSHWAWRHTSSLSLVKVTCAAGKTVAKRSVDSSSSNNSKFAVSVPCSNKCRQTCEQHTKPLMSVLTDKIT